MIKTVHVGIDNGVSGAIAVISSHNGAIIATTRMPVKKWGDKNEVDVRKFYNWLSMEIGNLSNASYALEKPAGAKSAQAAVSMAGSFHAVRGLFETKLLPFERVIPQRWQKAMLGKFAKGQSKVRALEVASALWPDESFTPKGCRKPHDGIVDALLIAEYQRRLDAQD